MPKGKGLEHWVKRIYPRSSSDDAKLWEGLAEEAELVEMIQRLCGEGVPEEYVIHADLPRIRPVLVLLAARAAGASDVDPELQFVAELLYLTLVAHDAALGAAGSRRRWIARNVLKRSATWLGGNHLLVRAMEIARHVEGPQVLDELIDTARAFADSQQLAQGLQQRGIPTRSLWEEHADGHTGALFAFCCRSGAQLAPAAGGDPQILGRYGRHVGRLWHIAEDLTSLKGPGGADQLVSRTLLGRPMLPLIIAIERDPSLGRTWRMLFQHPTLALGEDILERMTAVSAFEGTREVAAQEGWAAQQALRRVQDSPHRRLLERLASGLSKAAYVSEESSAG